MSTIVITNFFSDFNFYLYLDSHEKSSIDVSTQRYHISFTFLHSL